MASPDLAIVIPAYKSKHLESTLESIANQTCKNFNLYIGDDCSPYELKPIINNFIPRMSIIYNRFTSNLGGHDLVSHWERCIDMVQNESWIWLFSDDDIMENTCVEQFYESINNTPNFDIYHFNVRVIDDNGNFIIRYDGEKFPQVTNCLNFYKNRILGRYSSYVVEYIFNKKQFLNVGRFQNFDLAWGSDVATWVKLSMRSGIYTIENSQVYWRRGSENISPDKSPNIIIRKIKALIAFLSWSRNFFKNININVEALNFRLFCKRLRAFSKYIPNYLIEDFIIEYAKQTKCQFIIRSLLVIIIQFDNIIRRIN